MHKVTRIKGVDGALGIAGKTQPLPAPTPRYRAIYEIDSPDVINSPEWAKAIELGRWADQVRPPTTNRHHAVYEICDTQEKF